MTKIFTHTHKTFRLIAMMNNTYSAIISQSERAWSFQWAKTMFALEKRLNDEQKLFYLKKYSINLSSSIKQKKLDKEHKGDSGDEGASLGEEDVGRVTATKQEQFVPGLMIIRRTDRTRAETRRQLIGYWQVSSNYTKKKFVSLSNTGPHLTALVEVDWSSSG